VASAVPTTALLGLDLARPELEEGEEGKEKGDRGVGERIRTARMRRPRFAVTADAWRSPALLPSPA